MKPLTIVYVTSRKEPKIEWFFDSLERIRGDRKCHVIVVDSLAESRWINLSGYLGETFRHVLPKPTVWQGKHRLTKEDWWAKSNALNTGICLTETEWVAFADDRSMLSPHWLEAVSRAMIGEYTVCGSYQKYANLQVRDGQVVGGGLLGEDTRRPGLYEFDTTYGGSVALPLEWCLAVQGYNESFCDSLGLEDSMFGTMLRNSGYPIMYDSDMMLIEDRTPGEIDGALKRADKDVHLGQRAKSWAVVRALRHEKTSQNPFDIRNMRDRVLAGEPFPPPTGSAVDWFDQQPLLEME